MSGLLNVLVTSKRISRLNSGPTTVTAGNAFVSGDGTGLDYYGVYDGYDGGSAFGSCSPTTISGYTIAAAYEACSFTGDPLTLVKREVFLDLMDGPAVLQQGDLFGIICPGGQYLSAVDASFGAVTGNGVRWTWTVTTGTNGALYFPNGTLKFVA